MWQQKKSKLVVRSTNWVHLLMALKKDLENFRQWRVKTTNKNLKNSNKKRIGMQISLQLNKCSNNKCNTDYHCDYTSDIKWLNKKETEVYRHAMFKFNKKII